jgi:hypothetical protein
MPSPHTSNGQGRVESMDFEAWRLPESFFSTPGSGQGCHPGSGFLITATAESTSSSSSQAS